MDSSRPNSLFTVSAGLLFDFEVLEVGSAGLQPDCEAVQLAEHAAAAAVVAAEPAVESTVQQLGAAKVVDSSSAAAAAVATVAVGERSAALTAAGQPAAVD